jgi:hypothetical protein
VGAEVSRRAACAGAVALGAAGGWPEIDRAVDRRVDGPILRNTSAAVWTGAPAAVTKPSVACPVDIQTTAVYILVPHRVTEILFARLTDAHIGDRKVLARKRSRGMKTMISPHEADVERMAD